MAVLVGTIGALEQAALLADKSMWLVQNALRSYLTAAEWSSARTWATGASGGGTNETRADSPTRWVHDDSLQARSFPNTDGGSSMFLLFDLDEGVVDASAIGNHNFADIAGCQVRLGLADDSAYTTNRRVIAEWTRFGTERLVALDLTDDGAHGAGEYRRFTGVRYAYLEVTTTGTFASVVPRIGEIFLGRRRQLGRKYDRPGDGLALSSRVDEFEADSGALSRMVRHKGRRVLDLTWTADENDVFGDDIAAWKAAWETDMDFGTRPGFCVLSPATPTDAPLVAVNTQQAFEYQGPWHAARSIHGRELPPFVAREAAPVLNGLDDPYTDWAAYYSPEDIVGVGPYTWDPQHGAAGKQLICAVAYSAGVSTGSLLAAGIGETRVDEAWTPGTAGFVAASAMTTPVGDMHIRVPPFRPNSETSGRYLFSYVQTAATIYITAQYQSTTTLRITWRNDPSGAIYQTDITVTDGARHMLDIVLSPTGGAAGVAKMLLLLNGVDVSPADHSVTLALPANGRLGMGCWYSAGTSPMLGDGLGWGIRTASGIDLTTHQAHVLKVGL